MSLVHVSLNRLVCLEILDLKEKRYVLVTCNRYFLVSLNAFFIIIVSCVEVWKLAGDRLVCMLQFVGLAVWGHKSYRVLISVLIDVASSFFESVA